MKKFFAFIAAGVLAMAAYGQINPTETGASIKLDSVTTEVIVYAPGAVRVIKYTGERPELKPLKVKGVPSQPAKGPFRSEGGHNKYKLDTGAMWAALNEKDANVSFWSLGDTLIMAEQHKTGRVGADGVKQDFQMGRAQVERITVPGSKANVKGSQTKLSGNKTIATDKGFRIVWLVKGDATLDAAPREGKTNGDITVSTPGAPYIDYLFIKE